MCDSIHLLQQCDSDWDRSTLGQKYNKASYLESQSLLRRHHRACSIQISLCACFAFMQGTSAAAVRYKGQGRGLLLAKSQTHPVKYGCYGFMSQCGILLAVVRAIHC